MPDRALATVGLLHKITTSHPVSGVFFVFPYPPFQFLKLVVIGRRIVAAIPSPKRTRRFTVLPTSQGTNNRRFLSPARRSVSGELMSRRLAADVACLLNVL